MVMIHRPLSEDMEQEQFDGAYSSSAFASYENANLVSPVTDPFDPLESSPTDTNAIESSLWELAAIRNHYLASVAGLASVFGEVMNKQNYTMEDFLDHSYGTVRL